MRTPTIESKRLYLRPMTVADAPAIYNNWTSDARVAKHMRWNVHPCLEATEEWMKYEEKNIDTPESYSFIFIRKTDNMPIGSGGLSMSDDGTCFEIGYNFMYDVWGQGYATEAAFRIMRFALEDLGLRELLAFRSIGNPASGAVLEKCGFIKDGETTCYKFDGTPMPSYKYTFRADDMSFTLNNGVKLPMLGYGSFLSTVKDGKQTILDALECGYRYIDTAFFYKNEKEIGEAIKDSGIDRKELFLCSKVWPTRMGYEETKKCFEESCELLGTDYLDLYLIHWPKVSSTDENWVALMRDTWRALEDLYTGGRIRAIGLSNFLPHHIEPLLETARIKPMVDQLELHAGYMQSEAVRYLKRHGIVVQAWSPLGRGAVINDPVVVSIAEKYGKTPAQILLRFLVQKQIAVIPKASSRERMLANKDIFEFFLESEDVSMLNSLPETGFSGEHPDRVNWR